VLRSADRLAVEPGVGLGRTRWVLGLCAVSLLGWGCASGRGARASSPAEPPPPPAASDPIPALLAEAEAYLATGFAAADAGHLEHAREEFDRAIDLYLTAPGGARAEPRVAEAYRRALEAIHVREIEALAAGDGFTEQATEPASIDAVAALVVDESAATSEMRARAAQAVREEALDLPIELNDAVLSCIDLYQGRLRPWFEEALVRGGHYLPHIREVFAQAGIPRDLAYVGLVESAFKPNAYSRARARGVWQFIAATGRRYGLGIDWWVDERSDTEKATAAAGAYLRDLFERFGDWNLALAAYNAGEGKVERAIARYGTRDFWRLRRTRGLRRETKNYVPLIHAAIIIAKAPQRYGFMAEPAHPRAVERVAVEGAVDLRVIAECTGSPVEEIRTLNAELRRLATPPDRTFSLRVPAGLAGAVTACLAELPREKRVRFRTHTVRRGDTLSRIARANGIGTLDVARANGIDPKRPLRIGTELIIPVPARSKVTRASRPDTSEGRVRIRYRIRPGDTLGGIAAQHGATVRELQAWNGLKGTRIAAGDVLTVYTYAEE
jgi:membrane-bound lytic murein transglycosylase D